MTLQTNQRPPVQTPSNPAPQPPGLRPGGRPPASPLPPRFNLGRLFNRNSLLGQFRILAAVIIVLAVIALGVSFWVLSSLQNDFRKVVTKLTPSIVAAQSLGQALEDMDSRAADYQLTSRIDVTNPDFQASVYGAPPTGLRETAWSDLQDRRRLVDNQLAIVRSKAVEGDQDNLSAAEVKAINIIDNRFYDYYAEINLMKYELDQGHKEAALANYKAAEDILVGNLGASQRDANGNSREKVLKDNGWNNVNFTCATNCNGQANNGALNFDASGATSYDGIAANIHLLSEINQTRLNDTTGQASLILVYITAALVVLLILVIAVYYAIITHRVINLGFALAVVASLGVAIALVLTLNAATNDYNNFKNDYVEGTQGIVQASTIAQISADANADLSRLLLSPDSPGLDSTNPALTADVKQAFASTTLVNSYNTKSKQVQNLLNSFNNSDVSNRWATFIAGATNNIQQKYIGQHLLAPAILAAISPNALPGNQPSVRQSYNAFTNSLNTITTSKEKAFDNTACNAISEYQFNTSTACVSPGGGYLNLLGELIWVIFPLITVLVAAGIWLTTRLF